MKVGVKISVSNGSKGGVYFTIELDHEAVMTGKTIVVRADMPRDQANEIFFAMDKILSNSPISFYPYH